MSTTPGMREVSAEEFAAHALDYLAEVERTGEEIRIRRGKHAAIVVQRMPESTRNNGQSSLRGLAKQQCTDDELVAFDASDDWNALR